MHWFLFALKVHSIFLILLFLSDMKLYTVRTLSSGINQNPQYHVCSLFSVLIYISNTKNLHTIPYLINMQQQQHTTPANATTTTTLTPPANTTVEVQPGVAAPVKIPKVTLC